MNALEEVSINSDKMAVLEYYKKHLKPKGKETSEESSPDKNLTSAVAPGELLKLYPIIRYWYSLPYPR